MNEPGIPIGGEIELDPDPSASPESAPLPAGGLPGTPVATGRTALRLIARSMFKEGRRDVLLPSYLCASILQPFREESIRVRFYRITEDLEIDSGHLRLQMDREPPGAILFIHYFGFPPAPETLEALRRLRGACWVIEDRAHTSVGVASAHDPDLVGDFVFTSFRKYLPLPDGGFILNRSGCPLPELPETDAEWIQQRLRGKMLRKEFLGGGPPDLEREFLALFASAERSLDSESPMISMSPVSRRLLSRISLAEALGRRQRNFIHLLDAFSGDATLMELGRPLFPSLPTKVSPLIFPIRVDPRKRDALRRGLAERRAYCPVHWPVPREIDSARFPESARLSSAILGLPVDQRYGTETMQDLLGRLRASWRSID